MSDDELKALVTDVKRHIDVSTEATRSELRVVAEGVLTLEQRIEPPLR